MTATNRWRTAKVDYKASRSAEKMRLPLELRFAKVREDEQGGYAAPRRDGGVRLLRGGGFEVGGSGVAPRVCGCVRGGHRRGVSTAERV